MSGLYFKHKKEAKSPDKKLTVEEEFLKAAKEGNLPYVQALHKLVKDVHCVDEEGNNALHCALSNGHGEIAQYLVDNTKIDVSKTNKSGDNALHCALNKKLENIAWYLLNKTNIDVNKTNNSDDNALHCALRKGLEEVALYLINHTKVDVHKVNIMGYTPLMLAASSPKLKRRYDLLDLLLIKDADPNQQSEITQMTALIIATSKHDVQTVEILLAVPHIDVFAVDVENKSALMYARERYKEEEANNVQDKDNKFKGVRNSLEAYVAEWSQENKTKKKNGYRAVRLDNDAECKEAQENNQVKKNGYFSGSVR